MKKLIHLCILVSFGFMISCKEPTPEKQNDLALHAETDVRPTPTKVSNEFKEYWYAGEAEITSYRLEQARYGELREGNAVLIYVTEPFLADKQVKADGSDPSNIPILKLNSTKNYLTGIYPYSIMSSSFYPVNAEGHAIKVSFSAQEWCGQVYAQLNNRTDFEVTSHSYFEGEADQNLKLTKNVLENELWNKIRINPDELPVGTMKVIPSFEYIRLSHNELKPYNAILSLNKKETISTYKIVYPELERTLIIDFDSEFPFQILGWSEEAYSGFGPNRKKMTSTAQRIKTIKSPYWQKNGNEDLSLRDSLGL